MIPNCHCEALYLVKALRVIFFLEWWRAQGLRFSWSQNSGTKLVYLFSSLLLKAVTIMMVVASLWVLCTDSEFSSSGITTIYFAATTLTTVGLGDLHPESDSERVVGVIFCSSAVVFSIWFITSTISLLNPYSSQPRKEESLDKFLSTLQRMNRGKALKSVDASQFKRYFEDRSNHSS
mmetsp:Transcript_6220/g.10118  ORF Transcript_6220/g.10118 Transcript_6220/m.10118 type:complete len:178 (-) Transcript_6220:1824-2357(-)